MVSSIKTRSQTKAATIGFYLLPDECWEHVFKFILNNNDEEDNRRYFKSLSLVSKQFLSITNRLKFSLTIYYRIQRFLPRLFKRFTNLNSLNLSFYDGNLDALLCQISTFPLKLKSLKLPTISTNGLRDFSKKITTLISLSCSEINSLRITDLCLIAECFPLLEELNLSDIFYDAKFLITSHFIDSLVSLKGLTSLNLSYWRIPDELLSSIAREGLPLRKLVLQDCTGYSYVGIFSLLSKCQCIQHLDLQDARFLNDLHVVELSSFLGDLVSINLSQCKMLTDSTLFALVRNCPSLSEIKMEFTGIGTKTIEHSNSLMDFVSKPLLKSLYLAHNSLRDESMIMFASIFSDLQLLDLSYCYNITVEGLCQVLRRCCKIKHLNLTNCIWLKLRRVNFEVPTLEVLNLSHTCVDDETLHVISNSCCGILQLSLAYCLNVTKKGVKHVLENCTQLREINLRYCHDVNPKVVASMVTLRPSLRKIMAPPRFRFSDEKRKDVLHNGCLVC